MNIARGFRRGRSGKDRQAGSATALFSLANCNRFSLVFRALDGVAKRWRCAHRVAFRSWPSREIPALKRFNLNEKRSSDETKRLARWFHERERESLAAEEIGHLWEDTPVPLDTV